MNSVNLLVYICIPSKGYKVNSKAQVSSWPPDDLVQLP